MDPDWGSLNWFGTFLLVKLWTKILGCCELFYLYGGVDAGYGLWCCSDLSCGWHCSIYGCGSVQGCELCSWWLWSLTDVLVLLLWDKMVLKFCDGLCYFAHPEMNWLAAMNLLSCRTAYLVSIFMFWTCADQTNLCIFLFALLLLYWLKMLPLLFYLSFSKPQST